MKKKMILGVLALAGAVGLAQSASAATWFHSNWARSARPYNIASGRIVGAEGAALATGILEFDGCQEFCKFAGAKAMWVDPINLQQITLAHKSTYIKVRTRCYFSESLTGLFIVETSSKWISPYQMDPPVAEVYCPSSHPYASHAEVKVSSSLWESFSEAHWWQWGK